MLALRRRHCLAGLKLHLRTTLSKETVDKM